jgi:DNA-binding transcriptional MocR family regulator
LCYTRAEVVGVTVRFRGIVTDIAEQIHTGRLAVGARLPTERTLAEQLGVNRSTVAVAYAELEAIGLVERRQGSGTYVRGDMWGVTPDWPRYIAEGAFHPTAPLLQRIRAARREPGMIDLSEGIPGPALLPRTALVEQLHSLALPDDLGYPDPLGEPRLREAIARLHEREHGLRVDPASILVTTGGQQALYLITRGLLRPGDAVGIERPSYYYSLALFQSAGVRILPLPVDEQGVQPQAIRALHERHRLRMVLLNPTFQNPTGTVLPTARREEILSICRSLSLPLVEDDAYGLLSPDGPTPPPFKALDRDDRVLYVSTLSKTVAPALRLGWIAGPLPVIDRLADVKRQIDNGLNSPVQHLAAAFLDSPAWGEHLAQLRLQLGQRRDHLLAALQEHLGHLLTVERPAGGLNLWARFKQPGDDLHRLEAAIAAGVVVAPGRLYGAPDGHVRFTHALVDGPAATEAVRRLLTAWA